MTGSSQLSTAASEGRLTIDRIDLRVVLSGDSRGAEPATSRLVRTAEHELPLACARSLRTLGGGDRVIRIRELRLELSTDVAMIDHGLLAERWGRLLATAIGEALDSSRGVVSFDSPLDFMAAFLRDLLEGIAWGRWYWDEFTPIARLPVGAAATGLLTARPDWIPGILGKLQAEGAAPRLLARLDETEVHRIWAALGLPAAAALPPLSSPAWAALGEIWPRITGGGGAGADSPAREALRAWLALSARYPSMSRDPAAAALILALVDLSALAAEAPEVVLLLSRGESPSPDSLRLLGAGPLVDMAGWLVPAAGGEAMTRAARLAGTGSGRAGRRRGALSSPVGSVVAIAPALAELGLWELWLDELGEAGARRNIFATALKALGRERAPLALGDELVAAFAGFERPPTADARLEPDPEPPLVWREALVERALRGPAAGGRSGVAGLSLGRARGLRVLRDPVHARWLAAWPERAKAPRSEHAAVLGASEPDERERLELEAEAAHFQLGRRLGLPWLTPGLDAALSASASMVLRGTARRLPGFGKSGPGYLAAHFLAQPASLRRDGGELVASVGGGPLAAVLRMADLPELLELPWAGATLRVDIAGEAA